MSGGWFTINVVAGHADQRTALVALLHGRDVSWTEVIRQVQDSGSAVEVLQRHVGATDTLLPDDAAVDRALTQAAALIASWEAAGIGVHCFLDGSYPHQLRDVHQMPPLLFSRGTLAPDHRSIAIVGTREASDEGKRVAANVATTLVLSGVTVVSGLAKGIDTAAHEATLRAGGRTVAVIGTGIDQFYPVGNETLQRRIGAEGLVLSQFLPGSTPTRSSFPMRNAVMSGYAAATVVIEAAYRSGARMQARLALEHGRAVVLRRELLEHDWAQSYAQRPGVYVVGTTQELLAAVDDIFDSLPDSPASLEELPDFTPV